MSFSVYTPHSRQHGIKNGNFAWFYAALKCLAVVKCPIQVALLFLKSQHASHEIDLKSACFANIDTLVN